MRSSLFGALLGAGLVIAALAGRSFSEPVQAGPGEVAPSSPQGSGLITHVTAVAGQPQTVIVIDPHRQVMGVYHVDGASGEITLKSVRNITWDLQMIEFNGGVPSPQDIRSGLPR